MSHQLLTEVLQISTSCTNVNPGCIVLAWEEGFERLGFSILVLSGINDCEDAYI